MALKKFEVDGFLYYNVHSGNKRQNMITTGPIVTEHTGANGSGYNGCGLLVYPTIGGPAPSMRLKAVRDGFDDADYYYMLKNLKVEKLTPAEQKERQELLNIPESVIVNLNPENYDQTGIELLAFRKKLGEFLSRVSCKQ